MNHIKIIKLTYHQSHCYLFSQSCRSFPVPVEATAAGIAAGLVASRRIEAEAAVVASKCIHVEIAGAPADLALIDAVLLVDDSVGNYMPFEPARLRRLVLARAEPTAVGMSP